MNREQLEDVIDRQGVELPKRIPRETAGLISNHPDVAGRLMVAQGLQVEVFHRVPLDSNAYVRRLAARLLEILEVRYDSDPDKSDALIVARMALESGRDLEHGDAIPEYLLDELLGDAIDAIDDAEQTKTI